MCTTASPIFDEEMFSESDAIPTAPEMGKKGGRARADVREYLRSIGQKGGKAKVSKGFAMLSPAERKAIARKAVKARQAKKDPKGS